MPGQTIRIRFLDGLADDRARVRRWAEEWTRETGLRFVWTETPPAVVRITFNPPGSNWSFLGTECLLTPRKDPTMCLGAITDQQEREARRIVLFEFGHALGFVTELKKPDLGFHWNTQAVLDFFGKTYQWTPEVVYEQVLRSLPEESLGLNTRLDPDSIMTVGVRKEWPLEGIEIHENFDLSDGDKAAARAAYPRVRQKPTATPASQGP